MARNEEKANSMFNRWVNMRESYAKGEQQFQRPPPATIVKSIPEAERWRKHFIRELANQVHQIQNAGLGEHRIRELNDEINLTLRRKRAWERQIRDLGGPNHMASGRIQMELEGFQVPGGNGYMYFGAAKDLPGVRELFEAEAAMKEMPKQSRTDLYKTIDPNYFGFRDEEDGVLVASEQKVEQEAIKRALEKWEEDRKERKRQRIETLQTEVQKDGTPGMLAKKLQAVIDEEDEDEEEEEVTEAPQKDVHVPTQEEIERLIVQKKKEALLAKYASKELVESEKEAKALLNIRR